MTKSEHFSDAHCHHARLPDAEWLRSYTDHSFYTVMLGGVDPNDWALQVKTTALAAAIQPDFRLYMSFGLHPWAVNRLTAHECALALAKLRSLLDQETGGPHGSRPAAIGECGLDFAHRLSADQKRLQKDVFRQQCDIAAKAGLPVVIHSVRALDATVEILSDYADLLPAIMLHGFSGDKGVVARYLRLGQAPNVYFSVGPARGQSPSTSVQQALVAIPPNRLLIESDASDSTPLGVAGEPGAKVVMGVARTVGAARGEHWNLVLERSTKNLLEFVGFVEHGSSHRQKI